MYEDAHLSYGDYYNDEKQRWEVPYDKWLELIPQYRPEVAAQLDDELNILIATDCLSEGQNLQDADMQVNYDIHWNPVRLIQRFGRIDRIGSPNEIVRCVNFWPAKSFEEYLHLEERIMNRMTIMNLTGAETQEINEGYKQMVSDNELLDKNAKRLLSELESNSISDIESQQSLSLKDFSFEVYRQDLIDYFEQNKELFRKMPNGIFSGFCAQDNLFEYIPESLVAVVGYPHREEGSKKAYTEIYLMCQPVDTHLPATYKELNRAEILEFLRQNKHQERFVPEWVETNDSERLSKLTEILQTWMTMKAPQQAIVERKNRFHSKGGEQKKSADEQSLDKKFQMENFDLIVWEYVSK
jgi:superfamily II DNA/RNA helicase